MERSDTLRGKASVPTIGLLFVTMIIGYEWFISGLDKFVRGNFPAGLAEELLKKSAGGSEWYGGLLKDAVIPNARIFGYAIEASELLAGIALIAGSLIWLFAWNRVRPHAGEPCSSSRPWQRSVEPFWPSIFTLPTAPATRG